MHSEENFKNEMIGIFKTHGLEVIYNSQFGVYHFENIPEEKISLIETDISNVMRSNKWVCQVVISGNNISVRDFN